jgi:hypothetical protein
MDVKSITYKELMKHTLQGGTFPQKSLATVPANYGLAILSFSPQTGFVGRFKSRFSIERSDHNLTIRHPNRFGPTSVQFKSEINGASLCKRHQKRHLEFCVAYLLSRGLRVRISPGAPFFNYLQEILDFPFAISTSICHSTATIYSGLHLFIGITGLPLSGEFSHI